MHAHPSGTVIVLIGLLTVFATGVGAQVSVQGMEDSAFIQVALATFEFHAGVNLIVLAAYSFLGARAWPQSGAVNMRRVYLAVPGFIVIAIAIGITGWQYTEIGQAVSSKTVVQYAANWSLWSYSIQALQAIAALLIVFPLRS